MPKLRRAGQHARADLFKVRRRPSRPQAINAETRSDNNAGDVRRLGGDPIGCHVCAVNVSGKFILDVELASAFHPVLRNRRFVEWPARGWVGALERGAAKQ
jgi:hypothetical protein